MCLIVWVVIEPEQQICKERIYRLYLTLYLTIIEFPVKLFEFYCRILFMVTVISISRSEYCLKIFDASASAIFHLTKHTKLLNALTLKD